MYSKLFSHTVYHIFSTISSILLSFETTFVVFFDGSKNILKKTMSKCDNLLRANPKKHDFEDELTLFLTPKKKSKPFWSWWLQTVETGRLLSELFLPSIRLQADFFFGRNANPIQNIVLKTGR